eukprot:s1735_g1.t1
MKSSDGAQRLRVDTSEVEVAVPAANTSMRKPLFGDLELIHVVLLGGVAMATVAVLRLLHHEVRRKRELL